MRVFSASNLRTATNLAANPLRFFSPPQSLSFSTSSTSLAPNFNILFFCPRSEEHMKSFDTEYPNLIKAVNPESISVTDTAHNPQNNQKAISLLLKNDIKPSIIIPHLVLIGHSKEEMDERIRFLRDSGMKSIFAVRGNPATLGKDKDYTKHPQGYEDMQQLMKRIKDLAPDMKIIVAGYPEKHVYANSFGEDMEELRRKVDYGADMIITQHFFNTDVLLKFLDECQKRKIDLPTIPSILHAGNPKYLFSFSKGAGIEPPANLIRMYQNIGVSKEDGDITDKKAREEAVQYTVKQIEEVDKIPEIKRINVYLANNIPFLTEVLGRCLSLDHEKQTGKGNGNSR